MGSPNSLLKLGWTRQSLNTWDMVTVRGYLARDGSNTANAIEVTLSNGQRALAGSSIGKAEEGK